MTEFDISNITKNWGDKRDEFNKKIEALFMTLDLEEKEILYSLLLKSKYITEPFMNKQIKRIHELLLNVLKDDDCIIVPVHKEREKGNGFSTVFYTQFWLACDLKEYAAIDFCELLTIMNGFKIIIIVDDFLGSGETIKKTINKVIQNSNFNNQEIYIVSLVSTEKAKLKVANYFLEKKSKLNLLVS